MWPSHRGQTDVHLVLDLDHVEPLPDAELSLAAVVIPRGAPLNPLDQLLFLPLGQAAGQEENLSRMKDTFVKQK